MRTSQPRWNKKARGSERRLRAKRRDTGIPRPATVSSTTAERNDRRLVRHCAGNARDTTERTGEITGNSYQYGTVFRFRSAFFDDRRPPVLPAPTPLNAELRTEFERLEPTLEGSKAIYSLMNCVRLSRITSLCLYNRMRSCSFGGWESGRDGTSSYRCRYRAPSPERFGEIVTAGPIGHSSVSQSCVREAVFRGRPDRYESRHRIRRRSEKPSENRSIVPWLSSR